MNLNEAIKNIKSNKDAENFLKDLCTPSELKALEERWNVEWLDWLKGTPWEPTPGGPGSPIGIRINLPKEDEVVIPMPTYISREPQIKAFYVRKEHLDSYGMTKGCPVVMLL